MKILIIGYDEELTALTGKILERKGYDVACYTDIRKAFTLIECENIHLVIADIEAEESERLEFCKAIKNLKRPPKLLFIGKSDEEESRVLNAGADSWLKKPYKTTVFLARISALLRQCTVDSQTHKREELSI